MSYMFNDDKLLDKNNYPSLISLVDTEVMEAMAIIKMLEKFDFTYVDIWYHYNSEEAAKYVYSEYVVKVGSGRLNEFSGSRRHGGENVGDHISNVYRNKGSVAPASAQVLLFNSKIGTEEFLEHVLNATTGLNWKGKTFFLGYSPARWTYRDRWIELLTTHAPATPEDENTIIFFQYEIINLKLDEATQAINGDTPKNPDVLWEMQTQQRGCSKECASLRLSSFIPSVSVSAKLVGQQVKSAVNAYIQDGRELPCAETLRTKILRGIIETRHSLDVFGIKVPDLAFDSVTATTSSGYSVESYRASFGNNASAVRVLGKLGASIDELNAGLLQEVMPSSRQKVCSDTCQPGQYRHFPDFKNLPSCWVCIKCNKNTISVTTDANTCSGCEIDETSVDNTACTPVNRNFIEPWSLFFTLGVGLSIVGTILCIIVLVYVNMKGSKGSPLYLASDPVFMNTFLVALTIGCGAVVIILIKPSPIFCKVEYLSVVVFGSLLTSSLAFRVGTLRTLASPGEAKMSCLFSTSGEVLFNVLMLLINVGLGVVSLKFGGWVYHPDQPADHRDFFLICRTEHILFGAAPFTLPLTLIITAIITAFNMRTNPRNFGEAGNAFMGMLVVLVSCIMFTVGYKLAPVQIKPFLRCIILFTMCLAYLACIFIPKILVLYKGTDVREEGIRVEELKKLCETDQAAGSSDQI